MVQRGSGAGLPQQPRTGFVIQMRVVAHHLQGHGPPQLRILRPVDDTHTSGADPFQDPVERHCTANHAGILTTEFVVVGP
jgi:hypothetical protein